MRVYMNKMELETSEDKLLALLRKQSLHEARGIAVAVNEEVIPRNAWASHTLNENDSILIITATQGG